MITKYKNSSMSLWIPTSVDAQVPYIKRHRTVSPLYPGVLYLQIWQADTKSRKLRWQWRVRKIPTYTTIWENSVRSGALKDKISFKASVLVTHSCPTLCDSMDSSPPGSSVHGILQAGILEWVAIPFSNLKQRIK